MALLSCSSSKNLKTEKAIGKYGRNPFYGLVKTIELRNDQTFEYNWVTGLLSGKTIGSWEIKENKIILNSEVQPLKESEKYEVLGWFDQTDDSLYIKLFDQYNLPLSFATCVLKRDTTVIAWANTNSEGKAKLPKIFADSLIIPFVGYYTIRHPLIMSFTQYEFKMKPEDEPYQYFTNEIWFYKNGKFYPPIVGSQYKKEYFFKRIK